MSNFSISYLIELKDKYTATAKKVVASNKILDRQMRSLKTRVRASQRKFARFGRHLKKDFIGALLKVKGKLAIVAAAFVAVGLAVIGITKITAEYEKTLTNVFTLLGKGELKKFGGELSFASKMAIENGFSIQDANKALFDNVSALGMSSKTIKVFNVGQKLAIAGVTELSTSIDGITSIMNAYGKENTNATQVANAFFSAQRAGKTTVGELASNIGKVAPIAKQAGVGFKELLALTSQLTLGGLSTEESTTALRGAISGLIKPADGAKKVLRQFGVPLGATEIRAKGLRFTLEKLAIAVKKNPDALAEMIPNVRALTAIAGLGTKELKNYDKIINSINKDIKNGTGLNEAYAMQTETVSHQFKELWGQTKALFIEIGQGLAPFIVALIKMLKILITVIRIVVAAVNALMSVIIGIGKVIWNFFTSPFLLLMKVIDSLFAKFTKFKTIGEFMKSIFAGAGGLVGQAASTNLGAMGDIKVVEEVSGKTAAEKGSFSGDIKVSAEKGTSASVGKTISKGVNVNIAPSTVGAF